MAASETVWTATATNRSETAGEDKVFHTDKSCQNLSHAVSAASHPRQALANGWRECRRCAGGDASGGQARTLACPFCGEEFERLPLHMRGCDG
jgi:hypothetical protein